MAADVVLLEPSCPGGAPPGLRPRASTGNARAGPLGGAVGAGVGGLPSTADGRRMTAHVGLILARADGEPAPRAMQALETRAAATVAVRPTILCLTSRRHEAGIPPACDFKNGAAFRMRLATYTDTCPVLKTPWIWTRWTDCEGEKAKAPRRTRGPRIKPHGTGKGTVSLPIGAGIWQGTIAAACGRLRRLIVHARFLPPFSELERQRHRNMVGWPVPAAGMA